MSSILPKRRLSWLDDCYVILFVIERLLSSLFHVCTVSTLMTMAGRKQI